MPSANSYLRVMFLKTQYAKFLEHICCTKSKPLLTMDSTQYSSLLFRARHYRRPFSSSLWPNYSSFHTTLVLSLRSVLSNAGAKNHMAVTSGQENSLSSRQRSKLRHLSAVGILVVLQRLFWFWKLEEVKCYRH